MTRSNQPPHIALVPIAPGEFATWMEAAISSYGQQKVNAGHGTPEEANARARRETEGILTGGLETPGHHIVHIVAQTGDQAQVGSLWWVVLEGPQGRTGFILDLQIRAPFRRQGYAQAALNSLAETARREGLSALSLHVFPSNAAAVALYERLGYAPSGLEKLTLSLR